MTESLSTDATDAILDAVDAEDTRIAGLKAEAFASLNAITTLSAVAVEPCDPRFARHVARVKWAIEEMLRCLMS